MISERLRVVCVTALAVVAAMLIADSALACADCGCRDEAAPTAAGAAATATVAQSKCPVMGGKVEVGKSPYVDVKGFRVYVCCAGCNGKIEADPDTYLAKIAAAGETVAKAPVVLCGKCGVVKGAEGCCDASAKRCDGCGLVKGSTGCCKMDGSGNDAELCAKCGQIAGTEKCCDEEAARCKCGKIKGSAGCCL